LPPDWSLEDRDGLTVAICRTLLGVPGVGHAFSTRCADGEDGFDLGGAVDDRPEFVTRRARLGRAAGLDRLPLAPRQVHGARILDANRLSAAGSPPPADGVIAERRTPCGIVPAVRTADCVPILIADVSGRAVAAIHSGWRGTAAGIARSAVEALERLGMAPSGLLVALGPSIGACCYEVGGEVLRAVEQGTGHRETGRNLDLHAANARLLEAAGVPAGSISAAPWCTHCKNELFFSHRRDAPEAGRMLSCIGWSRPNRAFP